MRVRRQLSREGSTSKTTWRMTIIDRRNKEKTEGTDIVTASSSSAHDTWFTNPTYDIGKLNISDGDRI